MQLPPGTVYIKHNHLPDWITWLRQSIRPSKAWWEFRQALRLAGRGIATAQPLAFGTEQTRLAAGESFLISASLDDAQPLNDFMIHRLRTLSIPVQARLRQLIARKLGAWVANAQEAGLWHGDFHAGNLLVRWADGDQLELFLIDLSTVRLGQPLGLEASSHQLATFSHWFLLRCQRTDRLRFWLAYCQARSRDWRRRIGPDSRAWRNHAPVLESQCWHSNQRFWTDRDARCRENNRYYRQLRGPGIRGHAVRDLQATELNDLLDDPDGPFNQAGVKVLKDSPSSTVAELTLTVQGQPRPVIYKRFRVASRFDPLASLFRTSPAIRSWIHGQGFRERGLPTPRPLAVLERRRLGLGWEGYLLTEKTTDAQELNRHIDSLLALPSAEGARALRGLRDDLARLVRALHDRNYSHRDLKAANLLVVRSGTDQPAIPGDFSTLGGFLHLLQPRLVFIDLAGVTCPRRLSNARKQQNLARLHASFLNHPWATRGEKLRFLQTYLQFDLGDWKTWWRAIDRATQVKVLRNQKSGRILA